MPVLSETERAAWLRLARTPNIGPVTFANLIAHCGSAEAALEAAPRLARRGGGEIKLASADDVCREIDALRKMGGRPIASCEPDFPYGLKALDPPPPVISVLGNIVLLRREMIAIVGARNASALGRKLAQRLAADFGKAGLAVVSGLARGIDAAAHEGALTAGTVAVVAGGVDTIYPPENAPLYEKIKSEGALISEMPFGLAPMGKHFPRRNRIISGLARGVVVVEAAERSGSLITARYALEQNREVFAVPGSPLDPRAKGTNRLIRDGATLTETADDVLNVLQPMLNRGFYEPPRERDYPAMKDLSDTEAVRIRRQVIEALGPVPVAVDELIRLCSVPAGAMQTIILELELAGKLTRHPGNKVSWR
jgi:DNA processing protein